jgi:hypothetical protein
MLQKEITPAAPEPEANTLQDDRTLGWWGRFVERRRRPHAPGVWVVYFSLAAVALFGVGQLFIPVDNLARRQYAFQLLLVYTASGLGLLLTTSFLGLRRYLRQRRQEMPLAMVNLWLVLGVAMIVGVMLATMLLPRPNPEYAVSELPFHVGSPDQVQKSSPYGMGRDGVKEKRPWSHGVRNGQQPSDDRQAAGEKSDKVNPAKADRGSKQNMASDAATAGRKPPDNAGRQQSGSDREAASRPPPVDIRQWLHDSGPLLATLIKWLVYGVLALVAVRSIWSQRSQFSAALGNFGQWLSNFWHGLFGAMSLRAGSATDAATVTAVRWRRFADFTDPFATGQAAGWPPEQLVRYSFDALEAWAAEHDHPRPAEQTPHEFARSMASNFSPLAEDALRLADLYCQVAYAPGTLPAASTARLSRLWRSLASPIEHMASGPPSVR